MSELRTERRNYVNSKLLSFGVHMDYEGSKSESLQVSFHIYFIFIKLNMRDNLIVNYPKAFKINEFV